MSLDFITGLPLTAKNHDAILVFCDRLTKMVRFAPCTKDTDGPQTAKLFMDNVFRHHGLRLEILSDRDGRFQSEFWKQLVAALGTKHKMSSSFHPQTDGQTERTNKVLEEYLRHYVSPTQCSAEHHNQLHYCQPYYISMYIYRYEL